MNNKETYVSLYTARLLQQLGFDWEVRTKYYSNSVFIGKAEPDMAEYEFLHLQTDSNPNEGNHNFQYSAPTQQMALRWLRETKDVHIASIPAISPNGATYYKVSFTFNGEQLHFHPTCKTYEETLENAIQQALEVIIGRYESNGNKWYIREFDYRPQQLKYYRVNLSDEFMSLTYGKNKQFDLFQTKEEAIQAANQIRAMRGMKPL